MYTLIMHEFQVDSIGKIYLKIKNKTQCIIDIPNINKLKSIHSLPLYTYIMMKMLSPVYVGT